MGDVAATCSSGDGLSDEPGDWREASSVYRRDATAPKNLLDWTTEDALALQDCKDARSFDQIQDDALNDMKAFLAKTDDVNYQHEEFKGATMLWKAAELGHEKAVQEILRHPRIDPNKVRSETQTTPLYIAAHRGHVDVVRALASHPKIKINVGALRINASPLFVASQEGHEMVVEELMRANNIDINQPTSDGITPLCQACNMGHEHVVELLIRIAGLNVEHETKDGATALTLATSKRHTRIVDMIQNMKNN
jgi:ankyrin repeat protein